MDIVSHALIGSLIASKTHNPKVVFWSTIFSVLPDIPQIPQYFFVGFLGRRKFWIPKSQDWKGVTAKYPGWAAQYFIPHSFFILPIIGLVIWLFKLPLLALVAYALHIIIDIFTHTGEWSVKPFYPFKYKVSGLTNAWLWLPQYWVLSWIILSAAMVIFKIF